MNTFANKDVKRELKNVLRITARIFVYIFLIFLAVLSIAPFWVMIVNATRNTPEIQHHAISFLPSTHLMDNFGVFERLAENAGASMFNPIKGFINSTIVSTCATVLTVYFSTMTAYSIVAYRWKFRRAFFTFIMAVLMIPSQVVIIGFYKMIYAIELTNSFIPLIIPAIAAPSVVFFMKQYMEPSLSMEIVQSARVDGAGEFYTFNRIVLPIMKPAIATQAIFAFVSKWNELFLPSVLLLDPEKKTMPIMVSLLKGDHYKVEYGTVYLGLTLTVLPLFVVYFLLSKYIIAGVALGSVKG